VKLLPTSPDVSAIGLLLKTMEEQQDECLRKMTALRMVSKTLPHAGPASSGPLLR